MKITPLMVLRERASARARLYLYGEFSYLAAISPLFQYADQSGLTKRMGETYVTRLIDDIFRRTIEQFENSQPIFTDRDNGDGPLQISGTPGNSQRDANPGPET